MTVDVKYQPHYSSLPTVNTTAPADAVRKDSPDTHEDPGCVVVVSLGCSAMKEMPEPDEKTLRLLNDYQKASPALRESLSEGGFIAANGELDEPCTRKNWQMLWKIFPGEKFKDIPEGAGAGVTKTAEGLLHATELLLRDVVTSVTEGPAGTDELTGMQPAITEAEEEAEQTVDAQTLRLLLDEETRESTVATANEFIREKGKNREHLDDSGPELKAAVESLENTLGKLDGLDEAQETRLTALENKTGGLTSEELKELGSLQNRKKKLACPEDRIVLAAAVKVVKDSMEVIQVSPETAKGLSAGEKQVRLDACEALKDLSAALEDAVNILKSVRAAATGSDVLGLPEKLSNARHKIKNALEVVKVRRNESIKSTYPDKSDWVKAALVKVSEPGSKKDPVTDVMNSLKAHEQNLEKGVYRELICIREAIQMLSRTVGTFPEGKVRDAVSQLQKFCEFLTPDLKMLVSGKTSVMAGEKELKAAATAAVAMYRTLIGSDITADEPKTQRDVFNEAVDKLMLAHKSISIRSQKLKQQLRKTGLAFSLVREDTRNRQSVNTGTDTLTQLKEMAVALRGAYAKIAHVVSGVTEKMGSPGAERKKLTDLLEVKSDPLLTSLHWFELKGNALAGSAKAADKVADMLVHKKGTDSLSNVGDMRAKSAKAVSLARSELKEAFSFVEHRWQETEKTLHALQVTSQNEFTLAKAQLTAIEKDDIRKLPAQPEDISQQRKKVDTLRRFLTDIQKCQDGFKEAVNEARKAAESAEALTFSQDRLTKTEVGLPASEILLQAQGAMRSAAAALRGVTHREPEVYGPQQKVAIYLALVLTERVNEKEELSPAEKQAHVEVLAEKLAGDIDSPGFDRKAFAALIKEYYRQKCDGTLKLPREYRAVLAEPGLKWANLMTDKGAARLGSSLVSLALKKLISQSVNICMPGGIVGSAWGRIRGVVSAGLIYQAGKERVDFLKQSVMPGHALPSGTLSGARHDTWKFVAASTADAALPQVLRAAKNGLAMLSDIRKNGFAHTMEQADNHFVANNLISSGTTLAAAGVREGAEAAAEFITDAVESASGRNQVFPYRRKGDHVEQAVGKMADIVRRGRAGPEGMRKDEAAAIDRALDDALKDIDQEKARLNGILTKTERDFIKERGLTPKELMAACDAQSERLRSYQKGGENANQLVIIGKHKPGQREFDACVWDDDSRIFIREGASDLKRVLRHEVTHLEGKGERETRNIMATLMGLRTGNHSIARNTNTHTGDSKESLHNYNGFHFYVPDGQNNHDAKGGEELIETLSRKNNIPLSAGTQVEVYQAYPVYRTKTIDLKTALENKDDNVMHIRYNASNYKTNRLLNGEINTYLTRNSHQEKTLFIAKNMTPEQWVKYIEFKHDTDLTNAEFTYRNANNQKVADNVLNILKNNNNNIKDITYYNSKHSLKVVDDLNFYFHRNKTSLSTKSLIEKEDYYFQKTISLYKKTRGNEYTLEPLIKNGELPDSSRKSWSEIKKINDELQLRLKNKVSFEEVYNEIQIMTYEKYNKINPSFDHDTNQSIMNEIASLKDAHDCYEAINDELLDIIDYLKTNQQIFSGEPLQRMQQSLIVAFKIKFPEECHELSDKEIYYKAVAVLTESSEKSQSLSATHATIYYVALTKKEWKRGEIDILNANEFFKHVTSTFGIPLSMERISNAFFNALESPAEKYTGISDLKPISEYWDKTDAAYYEQIEDYKNNHAKNESIHNIHNIVTSSDVYPSDLYSSPIAVKKFKIDVPVAEIRFSEPKKTFTGDFNHYNTEKGSIVLLQTESGDYWSFCTAGNSKSLTRINKAIFERYFSATDFNDKKSIEVFFKDTGVDVESLPKPKTTSALNKYIETTDGITFFFYHLGRKLAGREQKQVLPTVEVEQRYYKVKLSAISDANQNMHELMVEEATDANKATADEKKKFSTFDRRKLPADWDNLTTNQRFLRGLNITWGHVKDLNMELFTPLKLYVRSLEDSGYTPTDEELAEAYVDLGVAAATLGYGTIAKSVSATGTAIKLVREARALGLSGKEFSSFIFKGMQPFITGAAKSTVTAPLKEIFPVYDLGHSLAKKALRPQTLNLSSGGGAKNSTTLSPSTPDLAVIRGKNDTYQVGTKVDNGVTIRYYIDSPVAREEYEHYAQVFLNEKNKNGADVLMTRHEINGAIIHNKISEVYNEKNRQKVYQTYNTDSINIGNEDNPQKYILTDPANPNRGTIATQNHTHDRKWTPSKENGVQLSNPVPSAPRWVMTNPESKGTVYVLTGTHGSPNGIRNNTFKDDGFYRSDLKYSSIHSDLRVINIAGKTDAEVAKVINSAQKGDTVIAAFCYSRNDRAITRALGIDPMISHVSPADSSWGASIKRKPPMPLHIHDNSIKVPVDGRPTAKRNHIVKGETYSVNPNESLEDIVKQYNFKYPFNRISIQDLRHHNPQLHDKKKFPDNVVLYSETKVKIP